MNSAAGRARSYVSHGTRAERLAIGPSVSGVGSSTGWLSSISSAGVGVSCASLVMRRF